ncbi:hypothetical protein [Algoriphagus boritolerans]|uniref:hypothetical protein n=1 Tax=Algoriphagus boritolerans TaxID=308111 RepID=UPI000B01F570
MFGLFTAFNADVVNDVTLYKAVVPARFGGRSSAILDILPKAGSVDKWGGDLMLSNYSGKLSLNGPLIKDKVSILGGFRLSYINWFLNSLSNPTVKNSQANFYDGNLVISAPVSENNEFTYSYYTSYDDFAFASDTTISWKNTAHSLQWKSKLSSRLSLEALATIRSMTTESSTKVGSMILKSSQEFRIWEENFFWGIISMRPIKSSLGVNLSR